MATLFLAAAGAAVGGGLGGTIAGLASAAVGKAVGASLGSVIDQKLLGAGSDPVETGKVNRFRVMGGSEGAALPRVFGRSRVAGQMIWSSRFLETVNTSNVGGKGGGQQVREYSYTVSFAVALCEGTILRVGRIWADGQALDQSTLNWRLHTGAEDQLPDPLIAAIEGEADAPAYRGTAYAVFEDLDLTPFGNRIPQMNFEVFRRPSPMMAGIPKHPAEEITGVALVPGTGEYSLATDIVSFDRGKGDIDLVNVHNDLGIADFLASSAQMVTELPALQSVSLVVSWFGDDLRCGKCSLRPAVEQASEDATMPWRVSGIGREAAKQVSRINDRPLFGGTPADASVIQAIRHLKDIQKSVLFYPFILMDIVEGNGKPDPWRGSAEQPTVPWRGRITLSRAPGQDGSPDKTAAAAEEVSQFIGHADADDFSISENTVIYSGPEEWSYRRFILHYAHLCALAGGVDAFCIGSEMRGLTQIRSENNKYPAVATLRQLAKDVRNILGPETKIGYAADWSEYFGHHPQDGTYDVYFNLDELWSDKNIDFIGIDNYMPISDWRSESEHADAAARSIYDLGYLMKNVAGGEGYDWYYADQDARSRQERTPIKDELAGEDWIFRYKDIRGWWSERHHNRAAGRRSDEPTSWIPKSKPIWFTELGCPAVDKGTNQPNVFTDPKSSESFLPYFSNGNRNDLIQQRYLTAVIKFWSDSNNNPLSDYYDGRMVDMSRAHVWAWDARPWPDFPARLETWADGENYSLGHWLNGRMTYLSIADVVADIGVSAKLTSLDMSKLFGGVTGYTIDGVETGRQSLQPLMLALGFDGCAKGENIAFVSRDGSPSISLEIDSLAWDTEASFLTRTRAPAAETVGKVTLGFIRADDDYQSGAVDASLDRYPSSSQSNTALVMRDAEARGVCERWLAESQISGETFTFYLPLSQMRVAPGDVLRVGTHDDFFCCRIDKIEDGGPRRVEAVRVERGVYAAARSAEVAMPGARLKPVTRVYAEFLDLPLLTGNENPLAPYVAVVGGPGGSAAVYSAAEDHGYTLAGIVPKLAVLGETITPLRRAEAGVWMPASLDIRLRRGVLQSRSAVEVLNGANAAAIRQGTGPWEVFQFRDAELITAGAYRLHNLLRGQAGTDGIVPDAWPAGCDFVLLDSAVIPIELPMNLRGLERHYRVGPANRPYDHASYVHSVQAFEGVGLRPYAPAHLSLSRQSDGSIVLAWVRRSRIGGDSWQGAEVPLGEASERYAIRISTPGGLLREFTTTITEAKYDASQQIEDGSANHLIFEVAQISEEFGIGPYQRISLNV